MCSMPSYMDHLDELRFKTHNKDNGRTWVKAHKYNFFGLRLLDLDEMLVQMNELPLFLRGEGARIPLKISVKKTKLLRLGINVDKKVMIGNEKIIQVDSFTYLGSMISKDGGCSEDVKSKIAKTQDALSQLRKFLEGWERKSVSQD